MKEKQLSLKKSGMTLYTDDLVWGDGTHPSTLGCIELLNKIDLSKKTVLDIGTGIGVLAIQAKKQGAENVIAVDTNIAAIGLASYNAKINNVEIDFRVILNNEFDCVADVIVANLNPDILISYLKKIKNFMNKGCKVIVTMPNEFDMRVELLNTKCDLKIVDSYIDKTYCAFLLEEE